MAYPSKTDRSTILEAALSIVEREGLEALTLRHLGGNIGVTANALYRYFRARDVLVAAAADAVAHRLFLLVEKAMAELPSSLDREGHVRKLLSVYADFAETNPALYRLLFSDSREAEAELPEPRYRGSLWNQSLAVIRLIVRASDAEAATISLWALMHGIWALRQAGVLSRKGPSEIEDYAFDTFIGGLRL